MTKPLTDKEIKALDKALAKAIPKFLEADRAYMDALTVRNEAKASLGKIIFSFAIQDVTSPSIIHVLRNNAGNDNLRRLYSVIADEIFRVRAVMEDLEETRVRIARRKEREKKKKKAEAEEKAKMEEKTDLKAD